MDISEIRPYGKNAKKHPKKQVEAIAASIREFGFNQPIVLDKNNEIIAGHGRYEAAKLLGLDSVPTIQAEHLSPAQVKAYRLADNKIGESDWEMDLVIEELKELDKELVDLTGFSLEELEPQEVVEDEVPEAPSEPKAKLGDLYILGEHRLLCGDATKKEDVERLMGGKKADMVFTDPPYGMNLDTDYSKMPSTSSKYDNVIGDSDEFDASILFTLIDSPVWYLWGADYYCFNIPKYKDGSYIVWSKAQNDKENAVIGSRFELCWVYPKQKKNVWFVRSINHLSERLGVHPTQKPVELAVRALKNSSKQGDTVLDLFGGSGSTLIACEQTNRKCYMMELDPKYIDVIVTRWENLTGKKAELYGST